MGPSRRASAGTKVAGRGSGNGCGRPAHDQSPAVKVAVPIDKRYGFGHVTLRAAECAHVNEFVMMMLVAVVAVLFVLRGEPERQCQRGEKQCQPGENRDCS